LISSAARLQELRNQLSHHLITGLIFNRPNEEVVEITRAMTELQRRNPNIKFALVNNASIVPSEIAASDTSPIILFRHPIFEEFLGSYDNIIVAYRNEEHAIDDRETENNLKKAFRRCRIDFIDSLNLEYYSDFSRPLVAIITNHPSVDDIAKNAEFYKALVKFLFEGGLMKHGDYNYAIINALEIKDV